MTRVSVSVSKLAELVETARDCFAEAEDILNSADAKLGDGDTGTMLKRLTARLAQVDLKGTPDTAAAFRSLAMAASASTGSSLGTLTVAALLAISKRLADTSTGSPTLQHLFELARDTMLSRGGAKPADKTVIDSLSAVAEALGENSESSVAETAARAARAALNHYRNLPNKMGRARLYGEGSRGLDDPGMLAFALLCERLAERDRD